MPLVAVHKAKRPGWMDRPPPGELRDSYAIAGKHVDRWARAYRQAIKELLTPAVLSRMRAAMERGDKAGVVNALPSASNKDSWGAFRQAMQRSYESIIVETGNDEMERENIPVRISKDAGKRRRGVPVVSIYPQSLEWIDRESADLIREVSRTTKKAVKRIVRRGFERGLRTDAMLQQIQERVGLLEREEMAVQRFEDTMVARGIPVASARSKGAQYASKLLARRAVRIARTETITAQSVGRRNAWRAADEAGELPSGVEREWAAVMSSPRTCEICEELDGQRVPLGEPYYSAVLGANVDGPGMDAHPMCRCVELLRRGG